MTLTVSKDPVSRFREYFQQQHLRLENRLRQENPLVVIATTLVAAYILVRFSESVRPRWEETYREKWGRLARKIPWVEEEYQRFLARETASAIAKVKEQWKVFGKPILQVPEKPWPLADIIALISRYSEITTKSLEGHYLSGSIYTNSFKTVKSDLPDIGELIKNIVSQSSQEAQCSSSQASSPDETDASYFDRLSRISDLAAIYAFIHASKMNPLHDEFKVGAFVEEQVIAMSANMFGGTVKNVTGVVTRGGTESVMLAIRAYRNRWDEKYGLQPGEPVIIVGASVHALVKKAGQAYKVRIIEAETDMAGNINMESMERLIQKHGKYVCAIIGSAPSYPTGVVDPIGYMGQLAIKYDIGFHVDGCLGGYVINCLPSIFNGNILQTAGLTSFSADLHKYGLTPIKEISVIYFKKFQGRFLCYDAIYTVPYWRGGIYGTIRDAGSYSAAPALIGLVSMLAIGKEGYFRQAHLLHSAAIKMAEIVEEFSGSVCLVTKPTLHMVTIKVVHEWLGMPGASYALREELERRGFGFSPVSNDMIHFCMTVRTASSPTWRDNFRQALKESLEALVVRHDAGEVFITVGGYGALQNSQNPKVESIKRLSTIVKFIQNWLLGITGANDAVRTVIMAQKASIVQKL